MSVRQDKVQLQIDFITDESRALAKTLLQTKQYNDELAKSRQKIEEYRKAAGDAAKTDAQRAEAASKLAIEEKKVADNLARVAAEGKKVEGLDLSKVTPAQLVERARQLNLAIRQIPQSAPEFRTLSAELQRVNAQIKNVNASAKNAPPAQQGGLIGRILGVAGGVGLFELFRSAISGLRQFGANAIAEVDKQLKADAQIREAIRSTSGAAGRSLADLKAQADALEEVTLFGADQTNNAQALLLTFTNIRGEIFDQTIPAIQDLSARLGQDLNASAIQVGKALNDPIRGVTALRKVGVSFTPEQEKMIKNFVDTNQVAKAQAIILKELETEFGGSARAAAEAGAGGWQSFGHVIGAIQEGLGQMLLNLGASLLPALRSAASAFRDFISVPVSETLEKERQTFQGLSISIYNAAVGTDERTKAINKLKQQYPQYLADINAEKATNEQLKPILDKINQSYIIRIALQKQQEQIQPLLERAAENENKLADSRVRLNQLLARGAELSGLDIASFKSDADALKTIIGELQKTAQFREGLGFSQPINDQAKALQAIQQFTSEIDVNTLRTAKATNEVAQAEQNRAAVIEQLRKAYGDLVDEATAFDGVAGGSGSGGTGSGGSGAAGKVEKESKAAEGSIAALREQISMLKTEIENSPNDTAVLRPLILQLQAAERALAAIEAKLEALKNPLKDEAPTLAEIDAQLGTSSTPGGISSFNQAELDAIIGFNDAKVEDELLTIDEITLARMQSGEDYLKMLDDQQKAEDQRRQEWKDAGIAAAGSVADAVFQIEADKIEQRQQAQLAGLEAEYAEKLKAAEGNSREQERLQKELERKKELIEKDAARKRKALALKEAAVEGALAILKALPNAAAAFAAGIAAAAQIAIISRQQFAEGGYTGPGYGQRDSSGFKPAGIVHEGEYVAPKWQVDDPTTAPVIRWLENRRLKGYAGGGLVSSNTTPTGLPPLTLSATATLNNLEVFTSAAMMFANAVATMPTEIKARVAYTDIETTGSTLNRVRSDASI